ncbi:hypothetical protein BDV06DRAFT_207947, partial [Aspergillus oleicola]
MTRVRGDEWIGALDRSGWTIQMVEMRSVCREVLLARGYTEKSTTLGRLKDYLVASLLFTAQIILVRTTPPPFYW